MSYRKITVGDKVYEYVVGKKFTKVKGIGIVLNETIGHIIVSACSCWDGVNKDATCWYSEDIGVTPKDIKKYILSCS